MKNENVHMQVLHGKLDVVLVQILRYHCIVDVSVGLLTHGRTLQYRTRWLSAVA